MRPVFMKFLCLSVTLSALSLLGACSAATSGQIAGSPVLILDAENVDGAGNGPTDADTPPIWVDISNSGNDGQIFNLVPGDLVYSWKGDGIAPNALRLGLNGTDMSVSTPLDASETSIPTSTWLIWVKPARLMHGAPQQIMSIDDAGANFDRSLLITTNTSNFSVYTGPGVNAIWTPGAPAAQVITDDWHFVVVVFRTDDIYFYLDGVKYTFGAAPTYGIPTGDSLQYGASNSGLAQHFQGSIAWSAVYNRELTETEMKNTCDSLRPRFVGDVTALSCNF